MRAELPAPHLSFLSALLVLAVALSPATVLSGEDPGRQGGKGVREGTLKLGDLAPDFTLRSPDGKATMTLSSFKGKKPVVLVFCSYT